MPLLLRARQRADTRIAEASIYFRRIGAKPTRFVEERGATRPIAPPVD
jgi:hypothetical protein